MAQDRLNGDIELGRRRFLRQALLWVLSPLGLVLRVDAAAATSRRSTLCARTVSIDVRGKGARGDGRHDDTAAFQAAIDALPASGGTITVTDGVYMIDAARAINMRSNTRLQMSSGARLTAIPNSLKRSWVIRVWRVRNVQIVGGQVVGERTGHLGTGGEWGYGINIQASHNISVLDTHISDCWGDGIWIGALGRAGSAVVSTDVVLDRVVSTNNRRQGLSIGPVRGVTVIHSTFSNSNGTKPQAGIDIEPQKQGTARDITISDCTLTGNHGCGMEMHDHVVGVVVKNCTIRDNEGYGLLCAGPSQVTIAENLVAGNGLNGVVVASATSHVLIKGNTLTENSARHFRRALSNLSGRSRRQSADLRIDSSARDVTVADNIFSS
jgi:hypothetical protein